MKCFRKYISVLLFLSIVSFPAISIFANEPSSKVAKELWLELGVSKSISTKTTLALWGNVLNKLSPQFLNYDNYLEGSIKYQLRPVISVEALYRQEWTKEALSTAHEKRPTARIGFSFTLGEWLIRNRHQCEWRFIDNNPLKYRYRTDLRIIVPYQFSNAHLTPYMQEELFVSDAQIKRSRCYIGLMGHTHPLNPTFYILWQSDKSLPRWHNMLAVGAMLEIKL